ncbi:MmgE/PrpD family protein [Brevibacterium salitolerans]|uniref:MmgE/PrpD family protein n=1 Tax=Brevibacterium salitolerans TaxID=1403566 RepID=A0ABN2WJ94_9MICO|nr:MmgE/PrpD family protein [Brevibacterium sp.]
MEKLPPVEEAVARLVVDLTYDVLSPEALEGARRLLQDQLGLQVGSSTLPWSRAVLEVARNRHVPGSSRTALTGDRMDAADAAFVNGAYGHGFEYDDAHAPSLSHPGSCVIPAALALGEELDADMSQVLEDMVAGYEVYTRIGTLAAPDILSRGFHPHAILSNFGAAAVVAKMRGFDLETTIHALAIAYSHASGATECTSSGGSIKRVHAGIGTRNGMLAAGMAAGGLTGPTAFLTGGKGFFLTYVGREVPDAEAARFSLDKPFEIANPLFKPYCCCAYNHAFIDGARGFADRAEQIERVDLRIQPSGDVVIGNRNANAYNPTRIEQLQYSLPFQFALSVLGRGERIRHPQRVHEWRAGPRRGRRDRRDGEPGAHRGRSPAHGAVSHQDGRRHHPDVPRRQLRACVRRGFRGFGTQSHDPGVLRRQVPGAHGGLPGRGAQ